MGKPRPAPRPLLRPITEKKALDHMRSGAALLQMHGKGFDECWHVVPGGPVSDQTAEKIKNRPDVIGQQDGLWPGHDQTWRMEGAQ